MLVGKFNKIMRRALPILLIAITGVFLGFKISEYTAKKSAENFWPSGFPEWIFNLTTSNWEKANFGKNYVYLQLARSDSEIRFCSDLIRKWVDPKLKIIIISSNQNKIETLIDKEEKKDIYWLKMNTLSQKDIKRIQHRFFIYKPKYMLAASGTLDGSYDYSVKIYLLEILSRIKFDLFEVLPENNIYQIPYLLQIMPVFKSCFKS